MSADRMQTNMPNAETAQELHAILDQLIADASRRGVFGKVALRVSVEDGILQRDIEGELVKRFRPPKRKSDK